MQQHRFTGTHADVLASGRPVAPGEFVNLSDEDLSEPHNQAMIEEGLLVASEEMAEPEATDSARERASEADIPLTAISGTGQDGRITVDDVERTIAEREEESQ